MVAPGGAQEDPFAPLKGAMKMRRLIAKAVEIDNENRDIKFEGKASKEYP